MYISGPIDLKRQPTVHGCISAQEERLEYPKGKDVRNSGGVLRDMLATYQDVEVTPHQGNAEAVCYHKSWE